MLAELYNLQGEFEKAKQFIENVMKICQEPIQNFPLDFQINYAVCHIYLNQKEKIQVTIISFFISFRFVFFYKIFQKQKRIFWKDLINVILKHLEIYTKKLLMLFLGFTSMKMH